MTLCSGCTKRSPKFTRYVGIRIKADRRHDLCRQCWRATNDRERERRAA